MRVVMYRVLAMLLFYVLCSSYSVLLRHIYLSFFFQAEDGIRDLVRSRGLGDVYKRQNQGRARQRDVGAEGVLEGLLAAARDRRLGHHANACLLYTSDAADERSSVDLGGRRIIKKKK